MEEKKYSTSRKLGYAVLHQFFLILMVTSIFYIEHLQNVLLRETESQEVIYVLGNSGYGVVYGIMAVVGLAGSLLILAYLTTITGRRTSKDTTVYLRKVDKLIPSDVLTLLFMGIFFIVVRAIIYLSKMSYGISGLLVTVGTITYLVDIAFVFVYLSFVRRLKSETLWTGSLCYYIQQGIQQIKGEKGQVIRHICVYSLELAVMIICLFGILVWRQYGLGIILFSLLIFDLYRYVRKSIERHRIQIAVEEIAAGNLSVQLDERDFHGQSQELASAVNQIQKGLQSAIEESIKNEKMKADLITNVSHDIKTPLTSIVNYVDLLKREDLQNENAKRYLKILDEKSQRLKQLTEDLVEASRISSGNIVLEIQKIDLVELLYQAGGEFNERFEARDLTIVTKVPQNSMVIEADGRQLYRVIENLYINASKYAMEKTRVYVELYQIGNKAVFTIKNLSSKPISIDAGGEKDLTERFVRGETSRTTEGSGLGLSIAKNLTQLMGGELVLSSDGDLFIATLSFSLDL